MPPVRDLVEKSDPALNVQISVLDHHLTAKDLEQWDDLDCKANLLLTKLEKFINSWSVSFVYCKKVSLAKQLRRQTNDLFYFCAIV